MRDGPSARLRCRNARSSDTTKGVDSSRQPDGGHGSRNPLRNVLRPLLHITAIIASSAPRGCL